MLLELETSTINSINLEVCRKYHSRVFLMKSPVKHNNNKHNTHNKQFPNRWPNSVPNGLVNFRGFE